MGKKTASIIGIVLGIAIIIVGFCIMNPETILLGKRDSLGSLLGNYGADFYTDIYHMTYEVGFEVQNAYVNICNAIGWLIVAIGLFDIAYFIGKAASWDENDLGNNYSAAPNTASTYTTQSQATPTSPSAPQNETAAPVQKATHFWRCNNCGQMISKSPCEYCGHNENATKAPYRCGKCGQTGPYDGNCPTCGSSIKFYNH